MAHRVAVRECHAGAHRHDEHVRDERAVHLVHHGTHGGSGAHIRVRAAQDDHRPGNGLAVVRQQLQFRLHRMGRERAGEQQKSGASAATAHGRVAASAGMECSSQFHCLTVAWRSAPS